MKIISHGNNYEIYPNELKTYGELPAETFKIRFNPMSGFSLERIEDFETLEEKIYGAHEEKINKVLKAFDKMDRSLGIILSGDKGIGKSLYTQLFSQRVIEKLNMPVILVTRAFPGIAEYIESIDQEVLVLFDEFEKVFDERKENVESQDNLLGLFDGSSQRKRIYMITVNELHRVNEFMLNRPGRFHYHFRFDYPDANEIETYLKDKIDSAYYDEIESVVSFSRRVKLNYDCLRAVAFELSMGTSFPEAIADLNIMNIENQYFRVEIVFENLPSIIIKKEELDLYEETQHIYKYAGDDRISLEFSPKDLVVSSNGLLIEASKMQMEYDEDNLIYTEEKAVLKELLVQQNATNKFKYHGL